MNSIQTLTVLWKLLDHPDTPQAEREAISNGIENLNQIFGKFHPNEYQKQHDMTEAVQHVEQLTITIKPKEGTTTTK